MMLTARSFEESLDGSVLIDEGKTRVRLVPLNEIPYLSKLADVFGNKPALLFDHPPSKALEGSLQMSGDELKRIKSRIQEPADFDACARYGNITLAGNPLPLEIADLSNVGGADLELDVSYVVDRPRFPLECNPMTGVAASKLIERIRRNPQMLRSGLNFSWILIPTDLNDGRMSMLTGFYKSSNIHLKMDLLGKGPIVHKRMAMSLKLPTQLKYICRNFVSTDYSIFKHAESAEDGFISSSLSIHSSWVPYGSNVDYFAPPPLHSTHQVRFSVGWKDSRIGNLLLTNDVSFVMALIGWITEGATKWMETRLNQKVVDNVQKFIQDVSKNDDSNVDDFSLVLWPILKECRSHATLKRSLELIINGIRTRRLTVPVSSFNKSILAQMFRTTDVFPNMILEPLSCTQMLLELGVAYLKGFIGTHFVHQKCLPSLTDLEPFFSSSNGSGDDPRKVLPIFLSLQTVNCLRKFIRFDNTELVQFTRNTLRHYCSPEVADPVTHVYTFTTKNVHSSVLIDNNLTDWRVHKKFFINSKANKPRVEFVFHFTSRIEWQHGENNHLARQIQESVVKDDIQNDIEMELDENSPVIDDSSDSLKKEDEFRKKFDAKKEFYVAMSDTGNGNQQSAIDIDDPFLYRFYGFTVNGFVDEVFNILISTWAEVVESMVVQLSESNKSQEQIDAFRNELLNGLFQQGKMDYLLEKWKTYLMGTALKVPDYVTRKEDETLIEAQKYNDENEINAAIEQEKKKILELKTQLAIVKAEKKNAEAMVESIEELAEVKENLSMV
ncbi:hypothetical protein FO519_000794 [Halicephalobus sp. NKZ332]|nr:hypothetical protein FO519_000794 [Halicephalobus sp. NKZ332]